MPLLDALDRHTLTTPDGSRIAWRSGGHGPALVFVNGLANNAYQWTRLLARIGDRATTITWDYRGHGDSEPARDLGAISIQSAAGDLHAVLDAAAALHGFEQVSVLGYSLGSQVMFEAWRQRPGHIRAMASILGGYRRPFDTFMAPGLGHAARALLRAVPPAVLGASFRSTASMGPLSHLFSRVFGIAEWDLSYRDFAPWFEHLGGLDPASFKALALSAQEHTAEDVLTRIEVPVLVVTGGRDGFSPPVVGKAIAGLVPRARHVLAPHATHSGLMGSPQIVVGAIEEWLLTERLIGG